MIAGFDGLAVAEMNLDHFFGLDRLIFFIFEDRENFAGLGFDDFAGGRVGEGAIEAEGDPAGLIAEFNVGGLGGRHFGVVENVQAGIGGVGEPDFRFVRRERDAVTWAAMTFDRTFLEAAHFDAMKLSAGFKIADFEAEQFVDVDEAERFGSIDGEGPDRGGEWADFGGDGVIGGGGDEEVRRFEAGHVGVFAAGAVYGVVRAGFGDNFFDHFAG